MKIRLSFLSRIPHAFLSFFKMHYGIFLALFFLCMLGAWGFIFWQYGYLVVSKEPQVTVRPVIVKEAQLKAVMENLSLRATTSEDILGKTFPNPFTKPQEEPR